MKNDYKQEEKGKSTKEDLIVPLIILSFLACSWFVYVYENRTWISAFQQVMSWMGNPSIIYTSVQIQGIPLAFLALIEIIFLGITASQLLLSREKSAAIKFISTLGLGFGLAGFLTITLGIFENLYFLPLNVIVLLLCTIFLSLNYYRERGKQRISVKKTIAELFSTKRLKRLPDSGFWLLAYLAMGIIFFFCFYHALLTIIVHWDSTVYHAVMSVIMYNNNGIPIIAGPSIGIQMSANFPPLFSALGTFFYIQIGAIEDLFLRAIPPIMGVLTVIATYKIGEIIAGKKYGLISALILSMTPLFFRYSIYATSYSTLTFFCTASILFLLLAITKKDTRYWIACGLFFGFATLTSYIALYLAPFFIAVLISYFVKARNPVYFNLKNASALVLSILAIGGVWYFRNWILLGNPIYPNAYALLGGINIDPLIMETTFEGIKYSGATSFFSVEASIFGKIFMFFFYRTHFPAISLFTILGFALLPYQKKKMWLVIAWPLIASVFILSGLTWAFPRHVVFAVPGFALLSALPIAKALERCEDYDNNRNNMRKSEKIFTRARKRLTSLHKSDIIRVGLAFLLFAAFLFPSLTLVLGGKVSMDNQHDPPPDDYLWLFRNPNGEKWSVITYIISEGIGWKWLDEHLEEGEKVAAVENRIYQIKNSSNDYFFYLDGWEARQLYNITDPVVMLQFLQKEYVKYILDVSWARTHGHFDILPLTPYLGSVYFPKIVDCEGNPNIYNVGPVENPITRDSVTLVSINQVGWSQPKLIEGIYAQSVIPENDSSRLLVATPNLTNIKITYHDVGKEFVSVNLHNPYSEEWINGYRIIQKNDTGQWKTYQFLAPLIEEGCAELAFHAYTENFTVSRIEASPLKAQGKMTINSLESETTNTTVPPTLMLYLPLLRENTTFQLYTNSFGKKICVELFEGIIQPWETTTWWSQHELVIRSPNSTAIGQVNPSLKFNVTKSGLYTLVIVPRERDWEVTKVDLQFSIGAGIIYKTEEDLG